MKNPKVRHAIFVLSIGLALMFSGIGAGPVQAISKNILTVAITTDPDDTDPRSGYDSCAQSVLYHMYEALTYYNRPGSKQEIGPWLATSWESNKDKTQWTFHLRQGVKFHDGTDFNAAAVKYTIENTVAEKMAPAWIYSPIKSMDVVDEHTIKFGRIHSQLLARIDSAAGFLFLAGVAPAGRAVEPGVFNIRADSVYYGL